MYKEIFTNAEGRRFALGANTFGDSYLISLDHNSPKEKEPQKPKLKVPNPQTPQSHDENPRKHIGQGALIRILESMKNLPSQGYNPIALCPKAGAISRAIIQRAQSFSAEEPIIYSEITKKIRQAEALEEFFDAAIQNEENNLFSTAEQTSIRYSLDNEQSEKMTSLAERVEKAKELVRALKERFGLVGENIRDSKSLYKLIFGGPAPESSFRARPVPFAIGFTYLPEECFDFQTQGDTSCLGSIDDVLSYSAAEIKSAKKALLLRNLAFRTNQKWDLDSTLDMLIDSGFSAKQRETLGAKEHELKHVIDKLIAPMIGYSNLNQEGTSSTSRINSMDSPREDYEGSMLHLRAELSAALYTSEPEKEPELGEGFWERKSRKSLTKDERTSLNKARKAIIYLIENKKIHPRTLSYMVAGERAETLFPTISALYDELTR